jgi:hypothetical protein
MKPNRKSLIDLLLRKSELLLSKAEVEAKGLLSVPPYSVVSTIYKALHRGNLDNVHIPHSDVYYVRCAVEQHTGYYFPLDVVEEAMRANGWRDRRNTWRY